MAGSVHGSGRLLIFWNLGCSCRSFFTTIWMTSLLHARSSVKTAIALTVGMSLSAVIISMTCVVLVWSQSKHDQWNIKPVDWRSINSCKRLSGTAPRR